MKNCCCPAIPSLQRTRSNELNTADDDQNVKRVESRNEKEPVDAAGILGAAEACGNPAATMSSGAAPSDILPTQPTNWAELAIMGKPHRAPVLPSDQAHFIGEHYARYDEDNVLLPSDYRLRFDALPDDNYFEDGWVPQSLNVVPLGDVSWPLPSDPAIPLLKFLAGIKFPVYVACDRDKFLGIGVKTDPAGELPTRYTPVHGLAYVRLIPSEIRTLEKNSVIDVLEFPGRALQAWRTAGRSGVIPVHFNACYFVDREEYFKIRPYDFDPHADRVHRRVQRFQLSDLYVTEQDHRSLLKGDYTNGLVADFPFDFREEVPAAYWMFQAAHVLSNRAMHDAEVGDWLCKWGGDDLFNAKRVKEAAKLVWQSPDRKRGRRKSKPVEYSEGRLAGEIDWGELPAFDISRGLRTFLVAANWWTRQVRELSDEELPEFREKLTGMLPEMGIGETEVAHVEHLVTYTHRKFAVVKKNGPEPR